MRLIFHPSKLSKQEKVSHRKLQWLVKSKIHRILRPTRRARPQCFLERDQKPEHLERNENLKKRTCDSKPKCKQQKQRRSSLAKKQIKPEFELEIKDVTIESCNTVEERLVLQIIGNVELYESNGQLTFKERAQLQRANITYLMTFQKPS